MTKHQPIAALTIRRLDEADRAAVAELAGRDSKPALDGTLLGAELEGRLVAAVAIATGESVADPFTRTAEIRSILEARAEELRGRPRPPGRMFRLRPGLSAARVGPS
jgi:hypothetical protein